MKALVLTIVLLSGCASMAPTDIEPQAIVPVSLWRWIGRAFMTIIGNTEIKVNIEEKHD